MATKKDRGASGAAIAGGGAVTAGAGLAAGGVPGGKSDFTTVLNVKRGQGKTKVGRAVNAVVSNRHVARAAPGGIFGFRTHAHQGGLYGFAQKHEARDPAKLKTPTQHFMHGYNEGKIEPEKQIIRHMKGGKKGAGVALGVGTGAVAYGLHRARRERVQKDESHTRRYSGTLLGVGGTAAAGSHLGTKVLRSQGKKWEGRASHNIDEAGKLVPAIAGREGKKLTLKQMHQHQVAGKEFPKSMHPTVSAGEIARNPKLMSGVPHHVAAEAGRLRGAAAQHAHFAEVYSHTAKTVGRLRTPGAIVAGVGAGGLLAARKKSPVNKRMSAFGVIH